MENPPAGLGISVSGIVQGVGFRPFVYSNAVRNNLTGSVWNTSQGVEIELFGSADHLNAFLEELIHHPPALARIDAISSRGIPYREMDSFSILESQSEEGQFLPVSPDMCICPDCLRELFDPNDRRYRYPFINCTNCGPRFSIIRNIPYDRPMTTMSEFKLCPTCQAEYDNPLDRRFHAQPVACADCGPRMQFITQNQIVGKFEGALSVARQFLQDGKIVAVKGLGGYHLACNASNNEAVKTLRERKKRSDRPFALMCFELEIIRKYCEVSEAEAQLLQSPQHPIVLLKKKADYALPEELAPNQNHLGFMLPYTPLHYLLLEPDEDFPEVLVMTSGNMSDEPIAFEDEDARNKLTNIADGFLLHNRPIHMRVDDSVLRVVEDTPYFIRRSRGYAPDPIRLDAELPEILACGAELKNTFCLSRDHYAFLSHHIGDLENYETLQSFEEGILHYQNLFRISPKLLAADLHPDYLSTRYAVDRTRMENLPLFQIQHHHAHLASCLADNHIPPDEQTIGLIFDGTGYGPDGKIWGGEVLTGSYTSFQRRFHLAETLLPCGDTAIRNPAKIALAQLFSLGLPWSNDLASLRSFDNRQIELLQSQLNLQINCAYTTSMGRLFDAVSALIGVRQTATYEGQAAIELENLCDKAETESYSMPLLEHEISLVELYRQILTDFRDRVPTSVISARFHNGLSEMCRQVCLQIRQESGLNTVALSGGVWQNISLLVKTVHILDNEGFSVLTHHNVPANDGGIALGQVMIAAHQTER